MKKSEKVYSVRGALPTWGDYGKVLIYGLAKGRDSEGRLRLWRGAPPAPPVFRAGDGLIVTENSRSILDGLGLNCISFRRVVLEKVLAIPDSSWAERSYGIPPGGEPESYFEQYSHIPELIEKVGPLWEVVLLYSFVVEHPSWGMKGRYHVYLPSGVEVQPLFSPSRPGAGWIFVSERGRVALSALGDGALRYEECKVIST